MASWAAWAGGWLWKGLSSGTHYLVASTLKQIVVLAIRRSLGSYIDGLDPDSLEITAAIQAGSLHMTDLKLRPEKLCELLGLPVNIIDGRVGLLNVHIPWLNLFQEPIRVELENVSVLVETLTAQNFDKDVYEATVQSRKQSQLQKIEQLVQESQKDEATEKSETTLWDQLVTKAVECIEVKIVNLHCRYEHCSIKTTSDHLDFAFGVTIEELDTKTSLQSIKSSRDLGKTVELKNVALYWNTNAQSFVGNMAEGMAAYLPGGDSERAVKADHVVQPVSVVAKLALNLSPENNPNTPKVRVNVALGKVNVCVKRSQLLCISDLLSYLQHAYEHQASWVNRPGMPVSRDRRAWFQYAISSVISDVRARSTATISFPALLERKKLGCEYTILYQLHLEKTSPDLVKRLAEFECRMDVSNIAHARHKARIAMRKRDLLEAERESLRNKDSAKSILGWLSSWWYAEKGSKDTGFDDDKETLFHKVARLSEHNRQELHHVLGLADSAVFSADLPGEYGCEQFDFKLKQLQIRLEDHRRDVLVATMTGAGVSLWQRASAKAWGLKYQVEDVLVIGRASRRTGGDPPTLLSAKMASTDEDGLFQLVFEANPHDCPEDFRFLASLKPVQLFYEAATWKGLLQFFSLPDSRELNELTTDLLLLLSARTSTSFQYLVNHKKTLALNVKLRSPIIVIPDHGKLNGSTAVLVMDLGLLEIFSSAERSSRARKSIKDEKELQEADFFDYFHVNVLDVQSFISNEGENWSKSNRRQNACLMPSFEVNMLIGLRLKGGPPRLPRVKINSNVTDLCFVLSEERIQQLFELYSGLPSPFPAVEVESSLTSDDLVELAMSHGLPIAMAVSRTQWSGASFARVQRRLSRAIEEKRRSYAEMERPASQCLSSDDMRNVALRLAKEEQAEVPLTAETDSVLISTDGSFLLSAGSEEGSAIVDDEEMFFDALEEPDPQAVERLREVVDVADMAVTCTIDEIKVVILQQAMAGSVTEKEYLRFQVDNLYCELLRAHHTAFFYDQRQVVSPYQRAHALIRSVLLEDVTSDPAGPVKLLNSPASQAHLINLNFHQVDESSPVLSSEFSNALQAVRVTVADLALLVHRESISQLTNMGARLLVHWNSIPARKQGDTRMTPSPSFDSVSSATSMMDLPSACQSTSNPEPAAAASTAAKYVISSQLNRITVQLCGNNFRLVDAGVEKVVTAVEWHAAHIHFTCRLQSLYVQQSAPDAVYSQICSIMHKSEDLFDLSVTVYDRNAAPSAQPQRSTDLDFNLKLRRLRVTYLHHFTSRLQNFLLDLQVMEQIAWVSEESSRRLAKELSKPRASRVKLRALLQAPILLFPRNSCSSEVLLIHLGNVKVRNVIFLTTVLLPRPPPPKTAAEIPGGGASGGSGGDGDGHGTDEMDGGAQPPELVRSYGIDHSESAQSAPESVILPVDKITFTLKDFVLLRMMHSVLSQDSPRHLLMEPINLSIRVDRSLQRDSTAMPLLDVSAHLDMVKVHLNRPDYMLLYGVWNENLAERPAPSAQPTSPLAEASAVQSPRLSLATAGGSGELYVVKEEAEAAALPALSGTKSHSSGQSKSTSSSLSSPSPSHSSHKQGTDPWDTYRVTFAFDGIHLSLYIGEKALSKAQRGEIEREVSRCIATADLRDGDFDVTVRSTSELTASFSVSDLRVVDMQTQRCDNDIARIVDRNINRVSDTDQQADTLQMVSLTLNRPTDNYYTVKACFSAIHCKLSIKFIADVLSIFRTAEAANNTPPATPSPESPVHGLVEKDGGGTDSSISSSTSPVSASRFSDQGRISSSSWYNDLDEVTYWCEVLVVDPDFWLVENPTRDDSPVLSLQFEGEFLLIQSEETSKIAILLSNLFIDSFLCGHWVDTHVMVLRPCSIDFFSMPRSVDSASGPQQQAPEEDILSGYDIIDTADSDAQTVDKLWVRVSQVSLNISPALIITIQNIILNVWDYLWPSVESEETVSEKLVDESMWQPKKMDTEKWKAVRDGDVTSPARILESPRGEKLFVDVDGMDIKFDIVHGDSTYVPVLALGVHTHDVEIRDWTTQLSASLVLALEITYFNRSSGVWEPLLEPLEQSNSGVVRPWKLSVQYLQVMNLSVWQGEPRLHSAAPAHKSGDAHARGNAGSGDEVDAFPSTVSLMHTVLLPTVEVDAARESPEYAAGGGVDQHPQSALLGTPRAHADGSTTSLRSAVLSSGGGDQVDTVGEVATCLVLSSSDLLSVTLSTVSLQLLTDVMEAYFAEVSTHNDTVRAQVSCLDVPVLVRNELGLSMDVVSYQELLSKPNESIIKTQHLSPHKTMRLSWPSHQPALASFMTSDAATAALEYVPARRPPRLPSSNKWHMERGNEQLDCGEHDEDDDDDNLDDLFLFCDDPGDWLMQGVKKLVEHCYGSAGAAGTMGTVRKDSGLFSKAQLRSDSTVSGGEGAFAEWPLLRAPDNVKSHTMPAVSEDGAYNEAVVDGRDEVDGGAGNRRRIVPPPPQPKVSRKPRLSDVGPMLSMTIDVDEDETDGGERSQSSSSTEPGDDCDENTSHLCNLWSHFSGSHSVDEQDQRAKAVDAEDALSADDGGGDETDFAAYSLHKAPALGGLPSPSLDTSQSPLDAFLQAGRLLASVGSTATSTTDSPVVNRQQPLAVQVDGFDVLRAVPLKPTGTYVLRIRPTTRHAWSKKPGCLAVACEVKTTEGQRAVTFHSVMEIKNHLSVELNVYCRPDISTVDLAAAELEQWISSELKGLESHIETFEGQKLLQIGRVKPGDTFFVPLFIVYEWELFVSPDNTLGFAPCLQGFSLANISSKQQTLLQCPLRGGPDAGVPPFCFRLAVELVEALSTSSSTVSAILSQACTVPRHILNFHPPGVLYNLLPFCIRYLVEGVSVSWVEIEPGQRDCLYTNSLEHSQTLLIKLPDYRGRQWEGKINVHRNAAPAVHPLSRSSLYQPVKFKTTDKAEKMYLAVALSAEESLHVRFFAPYWLVNKTMLPLEWKGVKHGTTFRSDDILVSQPGASVSSKMPGLTSEYAASSADDDTGCPADPVMFSFGKSLHKGKVFVRADVEQKHWPKKGFSLETVGSGDVVTSRSARLSYEFWLAIKASSFGLTKIVTISPQLLVFNRTKVDLQWADEDGAAKSNMRKDWNNIAAGKNCPIWPLKSSTGRMVIKPANGYNSSLPFDYRSPRHYVLRMDSKDLAAVCVEVRHCKSSLSVVISDYYQGAAPVRLENWCDSAIICFAQKGQIQQQFLWPGTSLLYTWPDPSGECCLKWWCGGQQAEDESDGAARTTYEAILHQDGDGSFTFFAAPIDSPVSPTLLGMPMKKAAHTSVSPSIQRGFWLSYLDGFQRVLLFTDKSAMRENLRRMMAVQMSNLQLYLSLDAVQVSLVDEKPREVAFISLASGSANWEVQPSERRPSPSSTAPQWEALPVAQSCALEAAFQSQLPSVSVSSAVCKLAANLKQMQMTVPCSGRLRRCAAPAVWLQYAQSAQAFGVRAVLQRLQVDDQLLNSPAISPISDAAYSGVQPFLETLVSVQQASSHAVRHVKCAELQIRDVRMKLDLDFVVGVLFVLWPSFLTDETSVKALAFQEDQAKIRRSLDDMSSEMFDEERALFSHLAIAPFKVQVNLSLRDPDGGMVAMEKLRLNTLQNALLSIGGLLLDDKTVTLGMDSYRVEDSRLSPNQVYAEIADHYTAQGLRQWYKFFFGPDVLSRPLHFIQESVSSANSGTHQAAHSSSAAGGKRHTVEALVRSMLHIDHGDATKQSRKSAGQQLVSHVQAQSSCVDAQSRAICSRLRTGEVELLDVLIDYYANLAGWSGNGRGLHSSSRLALSEISDGLSATLCKYSGSVANVLGITLMYLLRAVDRGQLPSFPLRLPRHVSLDGVLNFYLHHPSYGQSLLQALKKSGVLSQLAGSNDLVYITHGLTDENSILLFTQSVVLWLKKHGSRSDSHLASLSWHDVNECLPLSAVVGEPRVSNTNVRCHIKTSLLHVADVTIRAHSSHQAKLISNSICTALLYHQLTAAPQS
eukprot:scpid1348/ scgid3145/ Vacuolar protein sorting-associated protein 13C